jgi:hypothetical protein
LNIFAEITKGDSAQWDDVPFRDSTGRSYDALSWTLRYELRGPTRLTLNAVANGPGWRTTLDLAASGGLVAGTYFWAAYASKAGERATVGTGQLVVKPDLASVAVDGYDGRSQAQKDLDAINAAISARATGGAVQEYTIQDRSVKFMPMTELLALKSRYEAIVRRERQGEALANGLGTPGRVLVRFGG